MNNEKNELQKIKERNKKVEEDKAWELSKTRRAIIAAMTYLIIVVFLISIKAPNPLFNALVPTAGFIISTLTLPFFKNIWLSKLYRK